MADNNEESTARQRTGQSTGQDSSTSPPPPGHHQSNIIQSAMIHYSNNKTEGLLMITRILTIVFSVLYFLPFFGSGSFFKKVLIGNAATSALRLHQRLPRFQLTGEYINQLIAEDSCHYLLFSVIFLSCYQLSLVLVPVTLFATLHVAFSAVTLLDQTGNRSTPIGMMLSIFIDRYQRTILAMVAASEVLLVPFVVLGVLTGSCSLITPFIYGRFLSWRYASRRNPYTRNTFRQLRLTLESLTSLPSCPLLLRRGVSSGIDLVSRMAPVLPPTQQ